MEGLDMGDRDSGRERNLGIGTVEGWDIGDRDSGRVAH